ncbi:hypothetical protein ACLMJK_003456 [Lecanora helva]
MAAGLVEISNQLVYQGRLLNAPSTAISERPLAQAALQYINTVHEVSPLTPQLFLNATEGIFTVDSFQGGQNKCVIFDTVLSRNRLGTWGFAKDVWRLNVAVSRPEDFFVVVGDTKSVEQDEPSEFDTPDDINKREENIRLTKYLTKFYGCYVSKQVVDLIRPSNYDEVFLVPMSEADEFAFQIRVTKAGAQRVLICIRCREQNLKRKKNVNCLIPT